MQKIFFLCLNILLINLINSININGINVNCEVLNPEQYISNINSKYGTKFFTYEPYDHETLKASRVFYIKETPYHILFDQVKYKDETSWKLEGFLLENDPHIKFRNDKLEFHYLDCLGGDFVGMFNFTSSDESSNVIRKVIMSQKTTILLIPEHDSFINPISKEFINSYVESLHSSSYELGGIKIFHSEFDDLINEVKKKFGKYLFSFVIFPYNDQQLQFKLHKNVFMLTCIKFCMPFYNINTLQHEKNNMIYILGNNKEDIFIGTIRNYMTGEILIHKPGSDNELIELNKLALSGNSEDKSKYFNNFISTISPPDKDYMSGSEIQSYLHKVIDHNRVGDTMSGKQHLVFIIAQFSLITNQIEYQPLIIDKNYFDLEISNITPKPQKTSNGEGFRSYLYSFFTHSSSEDKLLYSELRITDKKNLIELNNENGEVIGCVYPLHYNNCKIVGKIYKIGHKTYFMRFKTT